MVVQPPTEEGQAGESAIQGQPWTHGKFDSSLVTQEPVLTGTLPKSKNRSRGRRINPAQNIFFLNIKNDFFIKKKVLSQKVKQNQPTKQPP